MIMKNLFRTLPLLAALVLPSLHVQAQNALPKVDGEIRKIDSANGKLTIRHGDIPNLDMPGMTMVFRAAPEIMARVQPGEKIRFTAERIDGTLTVTSLEEKP